MFDGFNVASRLNVNINVETEAIIINNNSSFIGPIQEVRPKEDNSFNDENINIKDKTMVNIEDEMENELINIDKERNIENKEKKMRSNQIDLKHVRPTELKNNIRIYPPMEA